MRTCTDDGSSPEDQWVGTAPHCTGKGHTPGFKQVTPIPLDNAAIFQSINVHLVLVIL